MSETMIGRVSAEDPESMPRVVDLLRKDRGDPPPFLAEESGPDLGTAPIPVEHFISADWYAKEAADFWPKVWQVACWENDIPCVGDRISYDIVDQSVLIVRTAPDEIKAFYNNCRHRGTRLLDGCTNSDVIQCPFHGWTWDLEGGLKHIPCRWDFPGLQDESAGLVEVKVGRWNGWVFINLDPSCEPLAEFIGPDLMEQWGHWPRDGYRKVGHVGKIVNCNWKTAQDAFLETYHVFKVHPEGKPYYGDANTKYDLYGPHGRFISPIGVPSPHLGELDDDAIVAAMMGDSYSNLMRSGDEDRTVAPLQADETARTRLADFMRASLSNQGKDLSRVSDTEVLDAIHYFVFPNIVAWGAYPLPFQYRFRPYRDVDTCLMEVMVVMPVPEGETLEPDVQLRMTPPGEPWRYAKELGLAGPLFDQDMDNLQKLQAGMKNASCTQVHLAHYQEREIRNFHHHLARYLERG